MPMNAVQQPGNRATVTPQLARQIRLLGLTAEELEAEAAQWLASNVMLEIDTLDEGVEHDAIEADDEQIDSELALDSNWDDSYTPMAGGAERFDAPAPVAQPEPQSPVAQLLRDLPMECRSAQQLAAAFVVLAAIDERGWLESDLHELACASGYPTGELL